MASLDESSVAASFNSVGGRAVTLSFPRTASLGSMQKALCNHFGQSFPRMRADLLHTSERAIYNEFLQCPLLNAKSGEEFQVLFSITTDPSGNGVSPPRTGKTNAL